MLRKARLGPGAKSPLNSFRERSRSFYLRSNWRIDPVDVDPLIPSGLFQRLLARHLLDSAVNKGNRSDDPVHVLCGEANAVVAAAQDCQIQCSFTGATGLVWNSELVFSCREMEGNET